MIRFLLQLLLVPVMVLVLFAAVLLIGASAALAWIGKRLAAPCHS